MEHLFLNRGKKSERWSIGSAFYLENHKHGNLPLTIAVKCRLGDLEETELALLDTGAEWTVIGGETAEIIKDQIGGEINPITIKTRFGDFNGHLHRLKISLLSEENRGKDLSVDGTALILDDQWPGPVVLGYRGFLERIKLALDPGLSNEYKNTIYFGVAI